jgi:hypothetical protein
VYLNGYDSLRQTCQRHARSKSLVILDTVSPLNLASPGQAARAIPKATNLGLSLVNFQNPPTKGSHRRLQTLVIFNTVAPLDDVILDVSPTIPKRADDILRLVDLMMRTFGRLVCGERRWSA